MGIKKTFKVRNILFAGLFAAASLAVSCGKSGGTATTPAVSNAERTADAETISGNHSGYFAKILTGKNDTLYAFYLDRDKNTAMFAVKKPEWNYWEISPIGGENSNFQCTGYLAAQFDKKDNPHLIFINMYSNWVYANLNAGSSQWTLTNIFQSESLKAYHHSADMKIDEWMGIHAVFGGTIRGEHVPIYFYRPFGGEWSLDKINTQLSDLPQRGNDPSLEIIGSNLYVSYGGTADLSFAYKSIGQIAWTSETIDTDSYKEMNREKEFTGIHVSPDLTKWIIYTDYVEEKMKIAVKSGDGKWKVSDISGISGWSPYASMTTDTTSGMHIAYYSEAKAKFCYAYKLAGGVNWKVIDIDDSKKAGFTAITLDSKGAAHILYMVTDNKTAVLKYKKIEGQL